MRAKQYKGVRKSSMRLERKSQPWMSREHRYLYTSPRELNNKRLQGRAARDFRKGEEPAGYCIESSYVGLRS
jgi:hypothetical protein